MSRHEALNRKMVHLALSQEEWRAVQHWSKSSLSDLDEHCTAHFAMAFALTHTVAFGSWLEWLQHYHRAEGLNPAVHFRSRLAAMYPARKIKHKNT